MTTKPIPNGFHTVTPYLVVKDAPQVIEFLKRTFDAEEKFRFNNPDAAPDTPKSGSAIQC